jgi:hypothetical protein
VDAVQGWSVGCLRSDVLSSQITSEEARLKLGAVKKADRTSVPEVIVVHEECIPIVAVAACQELLRLLAPDQADRFELGAAVSAKTISLAVDSDDESICTEREFPSELEVPDSVLDFAPPAVLSRTIAPWLSVTADCRLPVPVPESQPPPECYRCNCRNAPVAACSM